MEALKKVLVVDDDPVVGRSFERVLAGKGYAVITAASGPEALDKLRNERYDMLFTDIKMPGMSGLEVAERVKASQPWLPVVIVTGYGSEASEARAKAAGVCEFLHKPLSPEMIEGSAQQALRAAAAVAEATPAPAAIAAPVAPQSAARWFGMLLAAPFAGLALIVAAPFIGLAMLAGMTLRAFAKSAAPKMIGRFLKNAALFLAAPFVGLAYLVAFPFIGIGLVAMMAYKAMEKHEKTRQAVMFFAAPVIGLAYVLFAPVIGVVLLIRTLRKNNAAH